jgi:N-methylhydantoinase A
VRGPPAAPTAPALGALGDAVAGRAGVGATRQWWARARYAGQGHELEIPIAPGDAGPAVAARFTEAHATRYGFALDRPVEVVSARHAASGAPREARLVRRGAGEWDGRAMVDGGGELSATVRGPATVALPDATMLVREGWTARALAMGGWLVERDG